MKGILLCLAFSVYPGAGGTRQAPVAPIALLTQFQEEPSSAVREALQSELDRIMQPIGLHFDWRTLTAGENGSAVELVVVTFKGRCGLDGEDPPARTPGALGWTHVSDGAVLPFSDVDCDAVRGFLQEDLSGKPETVRQAIYGRALARVLAHELYHVLVRTSGHGECGVAKSGFTVADLLKRVFAFHASELRKLGSSKTYQILERAAALAGDAPTHNP